MVDGISANTMSSDQLLMWLGVLLIIALAIYGLRYVWRVWLFGASYRLAVKLRSDFYLRLSSQNPEFYLRHRTGDLMARATNDVD
ncbi:ABC transporter transmembrane domain-containing protein, partial [Xenorhabdus bovienii]|uniref:ABC transporter transmembrane domain-containing protein n=1 Tax=Xenorhabdus bovienii TaxID=40576 RepID=UPI0023B214CB